MSLMVTPYTKINFRLYNYSTLRRTRCWVRSARTSTLCWKTLWPLSQAGPLPGPAGQWQQERGKSERYEDWYVTHRSGRTHGRTATDSSGGRAALARLGDGQRYYVDHNTNTTSWERPQPLAPLAPLAAARYGPDIDNDVHYMLVVTPRVGDEARSSRLGLLCWPHIAADNLAETKHGQTGQLCVVAGREGAGD